MKKLYTIAMAAAVTLTAAANTNVTKTVVSEIADGNVAIKFRKAVESTVVRPAEAPDYDNMTWKALGTGKYASSVIADTYGASNEPADVQVFESETTPGVYKLTGVWAEMFNDGVGSTLIIDASDPEIVFVPKQNTGIRDTEDGITYIASQTWVLNAVYDYSAAEIKESAPDLVPTLDAATKTIMFPAKSLVLNWPEAPADSQFGTDKDAWYTGKNAGYLVLPGGEYKDPWVEVGEGTISGDFYFNCFGKTPTDYKVKVYQSTSNKNIYRVDDALKGLYASQGWQGVSPTFEFDVTDPANISLPLTSTGINGGTDGMYYAATSNQAYESISDCPEAYRATFKSTTTETGEDIVMDFPAKSLLLVAMTSQKIYYANTSAATLKVQKTSGVADIAIDDENAPVEYYNLQGVRINEPAAGTLVIRRQGAKVSKVLVK